MNRDSGNGRHHVIESPADIVFAPIINFQIPPNPPDYSLPVKEQGSRSDTASALIDQKIYVINSLKS